MRVGAKSDRDPPRTCAEKILAASIQSTKISLSGNWWCKHLICKELGVLEPFDNLSTGLDWIGVGTKDKFRPSLRTGQADFLHPALQLVVTFNKIDMPQRVLVLRYTSPLW